MIRQLVVERRINTNRNQSFGFFVAVCVFLCCAHLKGEQQAARSMERSSIINLRLDCLSARCLYKTTNSRVGGGCRPLMFSSEHVRPSVE